MCPDALFNIGTVKSPQAMCQFLDRTVWKLMQALSVCFCLAFGAMELRHAKTARNVLHPFLSKTREQIAAIESTTRGMSNTPRGGANEGFGLPST
jgi:hypothetical protein